MARDKKHGTFLESSDGWGQAGALGEKPTGLGNVPGAFFEQQCDPPTLLVFPQHFAVPSSSKIHIPSPAFLLEPIHNKCY